MKFDLTCLYQETKLIENHVHILTKTLNTVYNMFQCGRIWRKSTVDVAGKKKRRRKERSIFNILISLNTNYQ